MKLATELSKVATGRTLYILDEPTTGLHFADVQRLLEVLQRLVDAGNSVVVIEHNLDVIKSADRIIDMGPEGGEEGGIAIAAGTPEEVAAEPASHTGQFLVAAARAAPRARRAASSAQAPPEGRRLGCRGAGRSRGELRLWAQKWRWYERGSLPWNRARHALGGHAPRSVRALAGARQRARGAARGAPGAGRRACCSSPASGSPPRASARVRIGAGSFLNKGVMVASQELVEIGEHCMLANGCFVSDADHRFDDPQRPITWQGFDEQGPDAHRRRTAGWGPTSWSPAA